MRFRVVLALSAACVLAGSVARAQEEVYVRGQEKPLKGSIKTESPKGITLATGKDLIPAENITDVVYDPPEVTVKINFYRPAQKAEKASLDVLAKDADRKAALAEAIKKYEETAAKLTGADPVSKSARRHMEFKAAILRLREVLEEGQPPDQAIRKLEEFRAKHSDSWQIVRVLENLGRLQMGQNEFKEAEKTFKSLGDLDLTPEAKLDAQLLALQAVIQDGRPAEALKTLQGMSTKDGPHAGRVKVAQAQCLAATKQPAQLKQAQDLLRQVLKDGDKQAKALAHNALGIMAFEKGEFKEARWDFLWVDVNYNQDREEHAKALFYLWKTFEQLNDAVRAQECREALANGSQFAGSDYRRQAQRATKNQ